MYESNSTASRSSLTKSEYSYDQYHWCPTTLTVIVGEITSFLPLPLSDVILGELGLYHHPFNMGP
jgi:hypothetical protein